MDYYRLTTGNVVFANAKSMLGIFNSGSTHVVKVYRCYQFNLTTAVTGVVTTMQIRRINQGNAGTPVFPCYNNSKNQFMPINIYGATNMTVNGTDIFRRYLWSTEEAGATSNDWDNWELLVPFTEVWACGANDSNIQPLTSRANQGIEMFHSGSTTAGNGDFEMEFSVEEL